MQEDGGTIKAEDPPDRGAQAAEGSKSRLATANGIGGSPEAQHLRGSAPPELASSSRPTDAHLGATGAAAKAAAAPAAHDKCAAALESIARLEELRPGTLQRILEQVRPFMVSGVADAYQRPC